ncbi:MAG: glucosaminidase domain-containing protein [Candidatus Puniceispirillaceae bacterium]
MAALVAISLIVPGVFGIAPPQYFGDSEASAGISAAQGASLVANVADPAKAPARLTDDPSAAILALDSASTDGAAADDDPDDASQTMADATSSGTGDADIPTQPDPKINSAQAETGAIPQAIETDPSTGQEVLTGTSNSSTVVATAKAPPQTVPKPVTRADIQQTVASPNSTVQEKEEPAVRASKAAIASPEVEVASLQRTAKLPTPSSQQAPVIVARTFVKTIPEAHLDLPVKRQKEAFINMLLPLILAANDEIRQRRQAIIRAAENGDMSSLEKWARLYRIKTKDMPADRIESELLRRADIIPVSLALAQAAIESGWGTSRFAVKGNALFGQWAWDQSAGLKPIEASNSRAVVRSFPNLFGSVRAYMHNLNTHSEYARFRDRRSLLSGRKRNDLGTKLSVFLDGYAEIGFEYVEKIQTIIRSNDLGQFEAARLQ